MVGTNNPVIPQTMIFCKIAWGRTSIPGIPKNGKGRNGQLPIPRHLHSQLAMRVTNSERTKARGLGIGSPGPCLWVGFCGPGAVRCRKEASLHWNSISHRYRPLPEAAEPTAEHETTSLLHGAGQVCHLGAPETSHCQSHKKRGSRSSLWTLAGPPSSQSKRSLNIPVPPHIQIYTVPERRRRR